MLLPTCKPFPPRGKNFPRELHKLLASFEIDLREPEIDLLLSQIDLEGLRIDLQPFQIDRLRFKILLL
jgi:hypothetical protein